LGDADNRSLRDELSQLFRGFDSDDVEGKFKDPDLLESLKGAF